MQRTSLKFCAIAALLLLFGGLANAGPFEDGLSAVASGDYAKAFRLLRPLAEQGNARAQAAIGNAYRFGQGVPQDYAEMEKWYRLAAAQGNEYAQMQLGFMHQDGDGILKSGREAARMFRLAAAQGNSLAMEILGRMYFKGEGVPQDYVFAHMWYNLSIASGLRDLSFMRDIVASYMSQQQIAQAQAMARRCQASTYRDCD